MKKLRHIVFIMTPFTPVPATRGGAVEGLISSLVTNNEQYNNFKITIYSTADKESERLAKCYKNSQVIFINNSTRLSRIKYLFYRLIRKTTRKRILSLNDFDHKIFSSVIEENPDLIIVEGGLFIFEYKKLAETIGKQKMVIHLHAVFKAPRGCNEIFAHAIAISEYVKKVWDRDADMDTHILKNCYIDYNFKNLPDNKIKLKRKELGFESQDIVFLFVGRVVEVKGVREFCEAIIKCKDPRIKACIVGSSNFKDGKSTPYYEHVKEISKSSNGKIIMTGYIPNDQLSEIYQMADAQVIPSLCEEGAGIVTIEGMANGLPLIVTDSGGIREYANPEGTIVVHRDNLENELIRAFQQLLDKNIRLKMGKSNTKFAKQYSSTNYYHEFTDVIENILKKNE